MEDQPDTVPEAPYTSSSISVSQAPHFSTLSHSSSFSRSSAKLLNPRVQDFADLVIEALCLHSPTRVTHTTTLTRTIKTSIDFQENENLSSEVESRQDTASMSTKGVEAAAMLQDPLFAGMVTDDAYIQPEFAVPGHTNTTPSNRHQSHCKAICTNQVWALVIKCQRRPSLHIVSKMLAKCMNLQY